MRVVRFYHSCSSPPSPLPPPRQSSSPTSSPILIAKLLANLLCQLLIAVGTAGPQLPASDRSGHPWTSTASVSSQWASLHLHRQRRIPVGTPGPQPPASDLSGRPWTSTTRFYHQTLSQSIITNHHHKASSQYIITKHHHRTIFTNHYHRSFPQNIITIHHHKASSQIITTDHFHKASSQYIITKYDHNTSSQNIITKHLHKASSQYIITKHHYRPSSQIIITDHLHKASSQHITTKHHHKSLSQIIFTKHHHNTSSQSIITNHYHRSFSQSTLTDQKAHCVEAARSCQMLSRVITKQHHETVLIQCWNAMVGITRSKVINFPGQIAVSFSWPPEVDFHVIDYFEHTDDSILEPGEGRVNPTGARGWEHVTNMAFFQCQDVYRLHITYPLRINLFTCCFFFLSLSLSLCLHAWSRMCSIWSQTVGYRKSNFSCQLILLIWCP